MLKYKEYKSSSSAFDRRIPKHWDEYKISWLFDFRNDKNHVEEELLSVYLDRGVVSYSSTSQKQVHKPSEDLSNYQLVMPGDFVLNNQQAWRGSVGVSKYRGIISPAYYVLKPRIDINPYFLNYAGRDKAVVDQFVIASKGVGSIQRQIYIPYLKNVVIQVPPKTEQDQIVRYLDWKVSEMNHMIHGMKRQIKLLKEYRENIICQYTHKGLVKERKMNPSEFPWIEGVPEGWAETRLKYVLAKLSRERKPEHELLICSNKGKVFFRGDSKMGLVADDDSIYQGVKSGDLLIHGMDTWHGAIAISDYDGMCTGVVHVCDTKENKRFIMYYLQSLAFKKVYKKITNGVRENTSDFRSWDKAGQINLLLPPIEEQNEIARILDEKNDQIEQLIASLEQEIIFVEELKTKTIADVVTGQVDVRNVIIPEYTTDDDTDDDFDSNDIDDNSEESDEDEE